MDDIKVDQASRFLGSVLSEIEAGRLAPAGMQRPYVWSRDDVTAFAQSILAGFPVGSVLIWKPDAETDTSRLARGRLGPIELDGTVDHPGLLLDGQNRLATLAWMLSDATPGDISEQERAIWRSGETLVLDAEARTVHFVADEDAVALWRVPVADLVQREAQTAREVYGRLIDAGDEEDRLGFLDLIDKFGRRLKDIRVTVSTIEDATPEQARSAFLHICRAGVPMSSEDFDNALSWSAGQGLEPS